MAPCSSHLLWNGFFLNIIILSSISCTIGCYTAIFSFGDSLADTGNLVHMPQPGKLPPFVFPPYGETFFNHATGRCSNGRLVIDFIAEYLGLPFVPPYFGGSMKIFKEAGVNFAVAGATALDTAFLQERGIMNKLTNTSLDVQLGLFKQLLPALSSDHKKLLGNSLILLGEIGGNDYNHAFFGGVSTESIQDLVPYVVNIIGQAIKIKKEYDHSTGCLEWLNKFSEDHNEQLLAELKQIQKLYPHAKIIYADYYNAVMPLYHSPNQFGFTGGVLRACCGWGGTYNYNSSVECGNPLASVCDDPSLYMNWDGIHYTEAAYKLIFESVIEGSYSFPSFEALCNLDGKYFNHK
ncbi:hypothetical protein D5086_021437 [Populus alba]|uniref:Uncharacterized protein n=1 Tax=Populus alba TaxID=43335 RepID=A0ACC4BCH8_POPAL